MDKKNNQNQSKNINMAKLQFNLQLFKNSYNNISFGLNVLHILERL